MNWITNYVRPRINSMFGRREVPENLWIKCPETGAMVFHTDLEENKWVIPSSGFHMKMPARARLADLFDEGKFEDLPQPKVAQDPLKFRDSKKYADRLKENRTKTGQEDTIVAGVGALEGLKLVAVVHEFKFLGGSLGMAAGEAIIQAFDRALKEHCPLVIFPASGGARMQEGVLSLMQMPRVTVMVELMREAGLPYIVVLTNPTTGGVSASYAMLGDLHIAEPGAEIGFAGRRVIEQTIREQLPDGFQTAEYLLDHGMVDMVVVRHDIPETLARILKIMTGAPATANAMLEPPKHQDAIADETPHETLERDEAPAPAPQK
nr:acetyl-CoA carboxylase, carboxyltransferase subunit beta [Marinicella sp. W31]MDC2879293.1 acetyl-CoA carboxylase, carboxyltransferase subunit beta [Marinicella sp. W31]